VAIRNAPEGFTLFVVFALQVLGLRRRRDYVFLTGPIAEIDDLAALATKGKKRVVESNFFFTNGALQHTT
jgi:hypothetical protein